MGNRNFNQIENVFHEALDLPVDERAAYLAHACDGNESLYAEVCSLISASGASSNFLEQPALNLGFELLSHANEESMIGKVIGAYKILSRLGKGGMGEVYLAEDTKLGRKVALKFLSQELVNDKWAKRQLEKEAQAAARLDHPSICSVYDLQSSDTHSFIVMKFVEGETLADLIRKKQIQPDQVVEITRQIAAALAEAHAHGVIHRDIKPRNIMVTPDGQVKVLDFGLAKTIRQRDGREIAEKSGSFLTQDGIVAGTVAYMSPEQLRGERLDFRSDIFSLGTVLYELIEGQNPFARSSEAETISAILTSEPPIKGRNSHSNGLTRIACKCLAKDRDKRYQSATELLIELGSNSTGAVGRSSDHYLRLWTIGSVASVLILIIAFGIYVFLDRKKTTPGEQPANGQFSSSPAPVFSVAVLPITHDKSARSDDYLTEGLVESLIQKLSSSMRVLPYTSVSGYKGRVIDPATVGAELQVDAVLVGNVVPRNNRQILQSKLIKVTNGAELWSGEEEIKWQTIENLEDQLVAKVIESQDVRLLAARQLVEAHGTRNPEAFREYMQGRHYWKNRNADNINKAIAHFKKAVERDPLYAPAHAGLANSYVLLSTVTFGKMSTEDAMTRARASALEALELDPNLAEARTALGVVLLRFEWKWQEAERELLRAIELNPNYAPAHYWYSHLLLILGRNDEAVAESKKARDLDPFSAPSVMNYCRVLTSAGQYDRGLDCYDNLLKEDPENRHVQYLRALIFQRSGRPAEAISVFEGLYKENQALAGAALGYAYAKANRTAEARTILAQMTQLAKERYVPQQEFAIIYIGLGEYDNAFAALEKAYEDRFAGLIYMRLEPIFSSLRSDPRFDSLAQRMQLPSVSTNR